LNASPGSRKRWNREGAWGLYVRHAATRRSNAPPPRIGISDRKTQPLALRFEQAQRVDLVQV
jgi:hypothetical protein